MNRVLAIRRLALGVVMACAPQVWAQVAITDPPADHNFGKIPLQATYAAQYFSVWNATEQPVSLGQVRIDGAMATCAALGCAVVAPADFTIGGSDGCSGRTLAPQSGCSTMIGFVPQQPGVRVARLAVPVMGGADVSRILTGTGVANPFDCVMDWAERTLPANLVAQPTPTFVAGPFFARCYQGGALCVGADAAATTVAPASVYVYQGGQLAPLATLASLAAQATYPLPSTRRCDQPAEGQ